MLLVDARSPLECSLSPHTHTHTHRILTRRFKNSGNTCYMNACLRSLVALTPFTWCLLHARLASAIAPDSLTWCAVCPPV